MFQRNIRFHVEICTVKSIDSSSPDTYYVTFTLITGKNQNKSKSNFDFTFLTGQARRFKKLCEEIQALFLTSKERLAKQRRPLPQPPSQQQQQQQTNLSASSPRSNASFISSLFGNTNSPCKSKDISLDNLISRVLHFRCQI
jgi:hypothetical protein